MSYSKKKLFSQLGWFGKIGIIIVHVYDLIYYMVMTIAVCDMQSENTTAQFILWRKLNTIVVKKRLGTFVFKEFMVDNA
jgi:hypothetical protein